MSSTTKEGCKGTCRPTSLQGPFLSGCLHGQVRGLFQVIDFSLWEPHDIGVAHTTVEEGLELSDPLRDLKGSLEISGGCFDAVFLPEDAPPPNSVITKGVGLTPGPTLWSPPWAVPLPPWDSARTDGHLACPRTSSRICLPALRPSSMANKVRKPFGDGGGKRRGCRVASVWTLLLHSRWLGEAECQLPKRVEGEPVLVSPRAELEKAMDRQLPAELSSQTGWSFPSLEVCKQGHAATFQECSRRNPGLGLCSRCTAHPHGSAGGDHWPHFTEDRWLVRGHTVQPTSSCLPHLCFGLSASCLRPLGLCFVLILTVQAEGRLSCKAKRRKQGRSGAIGGWGGPSTQAPGCGMREAAQAPVANAVSCAALVKSLPLSGLGMAPWFKAELQAQQGSPCQLPSRECPLTLPVLGALGNGDPSTCKALGPRYSEKELGWPLEDAISASHKPTTRGLLPEPCACVSEGPGFPTQVTMVSLPSTPGSRDHHLFTRLASKPSTLISIKSMGKLLLPWGWGEERRRG
ncbi:hypothetical protein Cadr_000025789 [Camelus dromedarius]|uniref:Uncharacterized protein n=1 Tax=Camelus dromedarius TaxID=9838 RepID=A0A5N4CJJ1_CAMDR|nr:hypothetical protein Cadr_000025789 [Camelus dromedarius]